MNEKKDELVAAIIKVMQAVKGMEKNSQVGSGNYGYSGTKDQDVKEVFNTALSDNGLCIVPTDIQEETKIDRWTDRNGKQKQSVFTKVKTKYFLMHTSGQYVELSGYGHGVDTQDKGAGKATTYALKNCLLYTFLTPVGKIDDTETTHSEDIDISIEVKKKQKLTNKGFDYLMGGSSSEEDIVKALNNREMDEAKRHSLEAHLKDIQTA